MDDFNLDSLVCVEQTFYDTGYKDGFDHGRIHGLIEGRALGREQGFEMWEELGFYEGFARTWKMILSHQARAEQNDNRASQHIRLLLELISQFPRVNPSASDPSSDLDIPKLLRQIRSRYKLLCATLGTRPRLHVAGADELSEPSETSELDPPPTQDVRGSSIPVWKLDNAGRKRPVTNADLNF